MSNDAITGPYLSRNGEMHVTYCTPVSVSVRTRTFVEVKTDGGVCFNRKTAMKTGECTKKKVNARKQIAF